MVAATWQSLRNGDYPIITLEWRRMMRGKVRFRDLMIAAAAISLFGWFCVLDLFIGSAGSTVRQFDDIPVLTCAVIIPLLLVQQVVLWLVIPVYAARSVSAQRESGAFQVVALTRMSSSSIVWQIMAVAVAQALAVAVVSMPVTLALCTFGSSAESEASLLEQFGGVTGQMLLPVTAAFYASIGVFCSCMCSRTQSAIFLTYVLIVVLGRVLLLGGVLVPALLGGRYYWLGDPAVAFKLALAGRALTLVLAAVFVRGAAVRLDRLRHGRGGAGW